MMCHPPLCACRAPLPVDDLRRSSCSDRLRVIRSQAYSSTPTSLGKDNIMAPSQSKLRVADTSILDSRWWRPGTGVHRNKWKCEACDDEHTRSVTHHTRKARDLPHPPTTTAARSAPSRGLPPAVYQDTMHGAVLELLEDISDLEPEEDPGPHPSGSGGASESFDMEVDSDVMVLDWATVSAQIGGDLTPSATHRAVTELATNLAEWLSTEHASMESDSDSEPEPIEDDLPDPTFRPNVDPLASGSRRPSRVQADPAWFPWVDKITCVLDILRHLPRSLFSDSQMEVILWSYAMLGIDNRPSVAMLKTVDELLQAQCGIGSIRYKGPLGHVYYANDMGAIMAQEMANPRVRPHMHFYPEASASPLKESWQFRRWLHELSPDLATPMIRFGKQDYFVHEPATLIDGRVVAPFRWFTRRSAKHEHGRDLQRFYGEGWLMHPVITGESCESPDAYVVHTYERVTFSASSLFAGFEHMCHTYEEEHKPDPRNIVGIISDRGSGVSPWTHTEPVMGNRWRALAKRHRVLAFPIWLYCDDTSGNMSKKWNKHNSWLFTAAGLPRELGQHESNIHFLSTSNRAPPLEMLHGIVSQLEHGQTEGFWAWDCLEQEMVLLIPSVLGILGDNPMQSEVACHVGLAGKLFCRVCRVQGHVEDTRPPGSTQDALRRPGSTSPTGSAVSSQSEAASDSDARAPKRRVKETLQQLIDRAHRFLGDNPTRTRDSTLKELEAVFATGSSYGGISRAKKEKTLFGVKDTFQEFYLDKISTFASRLRGSRGEKEHALNMFVKAEIPSDTRSPVFRIKDFDPNQDTPVEILHVVLLGFIKYFWRDAMARIPKDKKELLKTRLSSVDVSGLGIPPLVGETLVTYAGSLTGRDFRAISQLAPFVLYDLVPNECYETWLALCTLVPLIWQPEILDLDAHIVAMEGAIDHFLNCTARWTPRWFNKPKFHLIRHLPTHVRRFGPAILFATEAFESFNAIIRSRSIHSNRQAPSRDIAYGFARVNRIRHVLSGGYFKNHSARRAESNTAMAKQAPVTSSAQGFSDNPADWITAGEAPLALSKERLGVSNIIGDFLGVPMFRSNTADASCIHVPNAAPIPWSTTLAAAQLRRTAAPWPPSCTFYLCRSLTTSQGIACKIGDWVLAESGSHNDAEADVTAWNSDSQQQPVIIGRVAEIIQRVANLKTGMGRADAVLIEEFAATRPVAPYNLPALEPAGWTLCAPESILCTVNVQHNCAGHGCDDSGTMPMFQERERVDTSTRAAIRHIEPQDIMLNTAQMRDAKHVQVFRITPNPLERDYAVFAGAKAEIDTRNAENLACRGSSSKKRRTSGLPVIHAKSLLNKTIGDSDKVVEQNQQTPSIASRRVTFRRVPCQ
ncbi:hypothetical protein C8Q80DRAFT_346349 [Daedaleopsis nitida]|nr:hypothetical protein C8Q80DRAFT_346349 [Daedaleopsis nitida]